MIAEADEGQHNKNRCSRNENQQKKHIVIMLIFLFWIFQDMSQQIDDGKKQEFAAENKNNRVVELIHLRKESGSKSLYHVVNDQFTHSHDRRQQDRMKQGETIVHFILGGQKNTVRGQI